MQKYRNAKKEDRKCKNLRIFKKFWDIFKQIQSQYAKHAQPIKTTFVGLNDCRVSQT